MRAVVAATEELRADEHLAVMLATEPGKTLADLTVEGVPRIIRFATRSWLLSPSRSSTATRRSASSTSSPV